MDWSFSEKPAIVTVSFPLSNLSLVVLPGGGAEREYIQCSLDFPGSVLYVKDTVRVFESGR